MMLESGKGEADAVAAVIHAALAPVAARALVTAAGRAQRAWAATSLRHRLRVLRRFRNLLAQDALGVAGLVRRRPEDETITSELWPLLAACRFLERNAPDVLAVRRPRRLGWPWPGRSHLTVEREPYGVVLIIAPGNYGLMLPGVQALQALAAGNAVIVKPAAGAAEVLGRFARLLEEGGLPPGLLSVTDDAAESAEVLIDGGVDRVVFTGSSAVGRRVLARTGARLVPTTLELSGWDACVVLDDANLDRVADALAFSLRLNRGATCVAPRRVLVRATGADVLEEGLIARLAGEREQLFDEQRAARAAALIRDAVARGARLVEGRVDGERVAGPVVLAGVTRGMAIFSSEVFAPLLMLCPVGGLDEAVALANSGELALGASVFGSPRRAREVGSRLRVGLVTINDVVVPLANPDVPLAPRRASGFGVTRGAEGLLAMTRPKATTVPRIRYTPHHTASTGGRTAALAALTVLAHGAQRARMRTLRSLLGYRRGLLGRRRGSLT